MSEAAPHGFRGYIGSRPVGDNRVPQHIQNLVIRDFAQRNRMQFLLSATEYAMPGCFMMLEQVADEVGRTEGVILYSIFMLPPRPERRRRIYDKILGAGGSLHGAVENVSVRSEADVAELEDILNVHHRLAQAPATV